MNEYKVYKIEWVDSHQHTSWCLKEYLEDETLRTNLKVLTVGFLVYQNDDIAVISCSEADKSVNSPIIIPKVAITYMKELVGWDKTDWEVMGGKDDAI